MASPHITQHRVEPPSAAETLKCVTTPPLANTRKATLLHAATHLGQHGAQVREGGVSAPVPQLHRLVVVLHHVRPHQLRRGRGLERRHRSRSGGTCHKHTKLVRKAIDGRLGIKPNTAPAPSMKSWAAGEPGCNACVCDALTFPGAEPKHGGGLGARVTVQRGRAGGGRAASCAGCSDTPRTHVRE